MNKKYEQPTNVTPPPSQGYTHKKTIWDRDKRNIMNSKCF